VSDPSATEHSTQHAARSRQPLAHYIGTCTEILANPHILVTILLDPHRRPPCSCILSTPIRPRPTVIEIIVLTCRNNFNRGARAGLAAYRSKRPKFWPASFIGAGSIQRLYCVRPRIEPLVPQTHNPNLTEQNIPTSLLVQDQVAVRYFTTSRPFASSQTERQEVEQHTEESG
jgi:hypothetical protein